VSLLLRIAGAYRVNVAIAEASAAWSKPHN
jgi:hypothetical protein